MPTRILSKDLEQKAKKELHEIPNRREEDLNHIKEWLKKEPHLHARTDDVWLLNFLRGCKFSLQKTKEKLDTYYTIRNITPEFFDNRDPFSPEIQNVLKRGILLPLESPEMPILLLRWQNIDPHEIRLETVLKVGFMLFDIFLYEDQTFLIFGHNVIDDFSGFPLHYMHQATPTLIKKMAYTIQKGYPIRIKGFHAINTPSIVDTFINTIGKPLFSKKISDRITVSSGHKNLHKCFPKSVLPKEYDGDGCSIEELTEKWKRKVESYRGWFLEDAIYRSDEKKRPGKPKTTSDIFGVEGSFRKLDID